MLTLLCALAALLCLASTAPPPPPPPKSPAHLPFTARTSVVPLATSSFPVTPTIFDGTDAPAEVQARVVRLALCFNGETSCSGSCTGSILNKKTILTASHCLLNAGEGKFVTAVNAITSTGASFPAKSVHVSHKWKEYSDVWVASGVHPGHLFADDIGIVRLKDRLPGVTRDIKFKLPTRSTHVPAPGSMLLVAGHGLTGPETGISILLQQGAARRQQDWQCRGYETRGFLCTDTLSGRGVVCPGDSGGPLYVKLSGTRGYRVVGVNSATLLTVADENGEYTFECGDLNVNQIYARVFEQLAAVKSCFKGCSPDYWVNVGL